MDYHSLGLKCGIEIHQQLDTRRKLFCGCPTRLRDTGESNFEFFRYLRPTVSEMGELDRAALEETKLQRKYIYKAYDTTCLVENDEEPPQRLNREALEIALTIAKMLHMNIVDELHTMRKIVVDGSNTTGFQRTALVATDGYLEAGGRVGITVLCLEEEAAQKVEEKGDSVVYSLDRLGIPLVEIGTAPDIRTPEQAREVASHIGMLLRSTGRVKRGLGTIRQDVNISIAEGARVEIKGVQELDLLPLILEREVQRQVSLLRIRDELKQRGAGVEPTITDVTEVFKDTSSRLIKRALNKGGVVLAALLRGFAGLVGEEVQPGRRLGTEFSERAKKSGVGGIFHSDELPDYSITQREVDVVRECLGAGDGDCVVLVADEAGRARSALEAVLQRAEEAMVCVPEETRRALPDGNSAYMRPLPGAARMYPETDVPPVQITEEELAQIRLPELLSEKKERFMREYRLNEELAGIITQSEHAELFEEIMRRVPGVKPTLVITTLHSTLAELRKSGCSTENITLEHLVQLFTCSAEGRIAREAIEKVLRAMAEQPDAPLEELLERLNLSGIDEDSIEAFIEEVVRERADFVQERGVDAVGPLMGVVMKELRGRASGAQISEILRQKITQLLNQRT